MMTAMMKIVSIDERPELFPAAIKLIEEALEYQEPNKFDVDFYGLINKNNWNNLYLLLEDNRPIAHLGVLPRWLCMDKKKFSVALIGGVAVIKDKRGQGCFHQLLEHIISRYTNYIGYFLWSDLNDFYQKYHFHQIGMVFPRQPTGYSPSSDYQKTLYRDLSTKDQLQVQKLHRKHTQNWIYLARSKKDWDDIAYISSAALYLKRNKQKKIIGYFFIHKGQDLKNIIHESFGIPDHEYPENLPHACLWPPYPLSSSSFLSSDILFAGLFRIGHPTLFKKFIEYTTKKNIVAIPLDSTHLTIHFQKKSFELTHADFLTGLFGPHLIEEFRPFYRPLWFGGVDSV